MKMKKTFKKVYNFSLSAVQLLKWLIYQFCFENFKNYIVRSKQTKIAVICGNGPSMQDGIGKLNLDNVDLCMVNFYLLNPIEGITPKHYVLADPYFFDMNKPKTKKLISILQSVNWDMNLYVPFVVRKKISISNPHIKIIPFHMNPLPENFHYEHLRNKMYHAGITMPSAMNVTVSAIYCMIQNGYERIELYGVEHSFALQNVVDNQNRVCIRDTHYYNKDVGLVPRADKIRIATLYWTLYVCFKSHELLSSYAKAYGVKIINKTQESFIDAYERES